jgi:DNA-binding Lrp family transcriptional regulator
MATMAYVLINTEIGTEEEVFEKLRRNPSVREVYTIFGVYDIIIRVECETKEKLNQTINKIRRLDTVRSTLTLICL